MKTKREVLEEFAKNGDCENINCKKECPYCFSDKCLDLDLRKIEAMAILRMFKEKKKPSLENETKIKFSNPDIDTSKYNIDENGNVLRNETLIKPWQQNMIELLEKNECLEKEIVRLKNCLKIIKNKLYAMVFAKTVNI